MRGGADAVAGGEEEAAAAAEVGSEEEVIGSDHHGAPSDASESIGQESTSDDDDDSTSSSDSDSSSSGTDSSDVVHGFREAVALLDNVGVDDDDDFVLRPPIDHLKVFKAPPGATAPNDDEARSFSQFVNLLRRHQNEGGGGRAVRKLSLMVDCWRGLPVDDMERLFGEVLPFHGGLEHVDVNVYKLPARFVRMLTERIPPPTTAASAGGTSPSSSLLSTIHFRSVMRIHLPIQSQIVQAIVDMLSRDTGIARLGLYFELDADLCRRICQAVSLNTNLTDLHLDDVQEVRVDTLDGVASSTSSTLRSLHVSGCFTGDDAITSLARQLRTNVTLRTLWISHYGAADDDDDDETGGGGRRDSRALLDVVRTYNCTIEDLDGNLGSLHDDGWMREQFDKYLARNERIREALEKLCTPKVPPHVLDRTRRFIDTLGLPRSSSQRFYDSFASTFLQQVPHSCRCHMVPKHLVPCLLGLVRDQPTVLYRLLKLGYVNAVSAMLAAQAKGGGGGGPGRGRRRRRALDRQPTDRS